MNITISEVKTGNIKKKITNLQKFLKAPVRKSEFNNTKTKLTNKWKSSIINTFTVRSRKGLRCDNMLQNSLGIDIKKNSIIIYVKPIQRASKGSSGSGGPVRNLTTILFRGSKASFGKYDPKWDARVNIGMHPGVSPSPMRNMWRRFIDNARKRVREALREAIKKEMKK